MADNTFSSIAAPGAAVYTVVHTVPNDIGHLANIRLNNLDTANSITVDLAICPNAYVAGAPADADFIESKSLVIEPSGMLEETAMLMAAGEKVVVRTSAATLSMRVHGYKQKNVVVSKLAVPADATWHTVHTVGAGKSQTANVRTVNLNAGGSIAVGLAVCQPGYADGAAPPVSAYLEPFNQVIEGGGLIENNGIALKAGEKVPAYTNLAYLAVRVAAIEE
jgi:hypothetical protein